MTYSNYSPSNYKTEALSTSGSAVGNTTTGVVFPLSYSEVNSYIGVAALNPNIDTSGVSHSWWLRSQGADDSAVGFVMESGGMWQNYASLATASRPAMWLDMTP